METQAENTLSSPSRPSKRLEIFLVAVVILLTLFFSFIEIVDYDLWMHLASGRLIASNLSIPENYPFAFSTDATWYYHEWLSSLALYGIEQIGGLFGLVFFRISFAFATLYVLYRILSRTLPGWEKFVVIFFAILLLKERWMVRPYLFTTLLFALYLYHLLPPSKLTLRKIVILAALMIPWANLHGGFIFGIALVGVFLLAEVVRWGARALRAEDAESVIPDLPERARHLSLFLALAFIASLMNPYFVNVYRVPVLLASYKLYHANIYEWFPPIFTIRYAHYWFMLFLTIAVCLLTIRKITFSLALLVGLMSYLFMRHVRFSDIGAIVFSVALAQQLPYLQASPKQSGAAATSSSARRIIYLAMRAVLTCLVAYLVLLHLWTFPYKHKIGTRERILPERAAEFIRQSRPAQNLFNMYHWGGYIEWTLFPEYRVLIDGRNEVFEEEIFAEYGNALIGKPGWEATLDKYDIQTALLSYTQIHPVMRTETRLQELLYESPQWALLYWDDASLVFVRRNEANRAIIEKNEERYVNPIRYDWIRDLAGDRERLESVAQYLRGKLDVAPNCSLARIILAQLLLELDQRQGAAEQLKLALKINPRSSIALGFLTILALEDGNAGSAFRYLRMRRHIGLRDKFYYNHKGRAYLLVRNYRAALRCFNKALKIDPAFSDAQRIKVRTLAVIEPRK